MIMALLKIIKNVIIHEEGGRMDVPFRIKKIKENICQN